MPCQPAVTSVSLGRSGAGHDFVHKMDMAQQFGLVGIELFHEDLASIAQKLPGEGGGQQSRELEAARIIHQTCLERGLSVICLQPFWHYEGLLDRRQHDAHIEKLKFWFRLARALRTDMIQIPSNFLPADQLATAAADDSDVELAVLDLREVADLGLAQRPPVRFIYEALAWGTRCDTWEESWRIVQRVDRPNFGLCLDTFNIAAKVWADPTSSTGRRADGDERLAKSLRHMVDTVDVSRLFCVQVVDAEHLAEPLVEGHAFHDAAQPARMSWSRNCRLFYGENSRGAFLPVDSICRAVFHGLGYEGWVSMELFHRRMADVDPGVPCELAARGAESWKRLVRDMRL